MEKLFKILGFGNLSAEEMQAMMPLVIIGAVLLLIVLLLIFDRMENVRFKKWLERNSIYDTPLSPWRTIVPWHRTGSRWYEARTEGPMHYGVKNLTKRANAMDDTRLYNKINKTIKVNAMSGHYFKNRR